MALAVAACADSDGDEASVVARLSDVQSCVEGEGLQVEGSPVPPDLNVSLGIVGTITVFSDNGGTGAITLYESVDSATEAREAESDFENDGVAIGQSNEIVYVYTGDEAGLFAIERCV